MGRLTQQEIDEANERWQGRVAGKAGKNILGTSWRALDRLVRLGGLGVGTVAGAVGEAIPGLNKWTPDVYSSTPEAFKAFWDQVRQGDWDAGIEAYQEEMGAGKGFWGTAELAGGMLPTGLPAMVGTRLISAAPKLGRTLGRIVPVYRGGAKAIKGVKTSPRLAASQNIETAARWLGKGLRAPWEAEELVGRTAMKGLGFGARSIIHPRTGPLAQAVGKFPPLLGQAPTPPITPAGRVAGEVLEEGAGGRPVEMIDQPPPVTPDVEEVVKEPARAAKRAARKAKATARRAKGAAPEEMHFTETVDDASEQAKRAIDSVDPAPTGQGIAPPIGWQQSVGADLVDPLLPRNLRQAKPKYFNVLPQFESDIDKALYIVSKRTKLSKRDHLYMKFLQDLFPKKTPDEISMLGREVRVHIKNAVGVQDEGVVWISRSDAVARDLDPLRRVAKQKVGKVPLIITKVMRAQLKSKGHADEGIDKMTPEQAWDLLGGTPEGTGPGGRGPRGRDPKGPQPGDNLDETLDEIEDLAEQFATKDELAIKEKVSYVDKAGEVVEAALWRARTFLRRHEAAINVAQLEIGNIARNGEKVFRTLGLSVGREGREVILKTATEEGGDIRQLYRALHGEAGVETVPERLRGVYDDLRRLTDWEQNARIDFDPQLKLVGQTTDESQYFYRGWRMSDRLKKAIKEEKGKLGWPEGFTKPRKDATFDVMLEAGFEPLSWNPYEQWSVGTLQGMRYREQVLFLKRLKKLGLARASGDASDSSMNGWRVPKVGPAFEGKIHTYIDEATGNPDYYVHKWVVPNNLAKRLENMYGVTPQMQPLDTGFTKGPEWAKSIDMLKVIDFLTFVPKRAKLYLSFFQQQDFLTRSFAGTWTLMVDELYRGVKTKDPTSAIRAVKHLATWPASAYKILQANLSPGYRARLRTQLTSTTPLSPKTINGRTYKGVHLKGIMEAGLSIRDVTMFPANMDEVMREIASENGLLGVKKVMRLISEIDSASRRGLFDGVYPAAQITDIQNNVANLFINQFPDYSDEAINGMIAKFINMKYSTIPASQSIFQNQTMRMVLQRMFFSVGESEGLLRQAFEMAPGRSYSALWRKHWAGAYLGLIATANAIHFASTGKPLPMERYIPLDKDGWGPLPIGYRTQFAAPTLPTGKDPKWYAPLSRFALGGRNATENTLDLVGQMDTAFRVLDPVGFLSSRESVPIRALSNQVTGTNFFGEPIDEVGPGGIVSRAASFIKDMTAPIGVGETASEILREQVPGMETVLPFGEGRTGIPGKVIRSMGINVRGESTTNLRNRLARESGLRNPDTGQPVQTWEELLPGQEQEVRAMFPQLSEEEEIRTKVQAERQNKYAMTRVEVERHEDSLMSKAQRLTAKYLDVPLTEGNYNPESARKGIGKAEDIYYGELYGTVWSEEKGRFTEGIYDDDIDFEVPQENTIAHALWRYRNIYQDARDRVTGEVGFQGEAGELLNKAVNEFWAGLSRREVTEVLANIRLLEGEYPREIQVMKAAGRYAGSLKLNFAGQAVGYYDLENHPLIEQYIARESGVDSIAIKEYLDKTLSERKAARRTAQGELIGKALDKAARENGLLWRMRKTYVDNMPTEWKQAMFEAGYSYQGKKDIEKGVIARIKAGGTLRELDYKKMYLDVIIGQ